MYIRNIYFLIKIAAILILGTGLGFYLLKKKNEGGVLMYPKYKCFGCGNIWYDGNLFAVCPICRGKGQKIKEGFEVKKVVKRLKKRR